LSPNANGKANLLNTYNSTIHGTTNEIPLERLKNEGLRDHDTAPPYHNVREENRKISRDSYVSYLGNRYSVPYRFAGRNCLLQISDKTFNVFVGKDMICTHEIQPGRNKKYEGYIANPLLQTVISHDTFMNLHES